MNPPVPFSLVSGARALRLETPDVLEYLQENVSADCVKQGGRTLQFVTDGMQPGPNASDVSINFHLVQLKEHVAESAKLSSVRFSNLQHTMGIDYSAERGNEPTVLAGGPFLFTSKSKHKDAFMAYDSIAITDIQQVAERRHSKGFEVPNYTGITLYDTEAVVQLKVTGSSEGKADEVHELTCRMNTHSRKSLMAETERAEAVQAEYRDRQERRRAAQQAALENDPTLKVVRQVAARGGNCPTIAQHLVAHRDRALSTGDWSSFQITLGQAAAYGC